MVWSNWWNHLLLAVLELNSAYQKEFSAFQCDVNEVLCCFLKREICSNTVRQTARHEVEYFKAGTMLNLLKVLSETHDHLLEQQFRQNLSAKTILEPYQRIAKPFNGGYHSCYTFNHETGPKAVRGFSRSLSALGKVVRWEHPDLCLEDQKPNKRGREQLKM